MSIEVYDYIDVAKRASELKCEQPVTFAILPKNFVTAHTKGELVYNQSTGMIRALWKQAGIVETPLEKQGDVFPEVQVKSGEWIAPILFIGVSVISQNPNLIAIALSVIANYVTDFFKGNLYHKGVTFDIIVEKSEKRQYKRIHYEGSVEDLKKVDLQKIVQKIQQGM
jgi:hypothetical protein